MLLTVAIGAGDSIACVTVVTCSAITRSGVEARPPTSLSRVILSGTTQSVAFMFEFLATQIHMSKALELIEMSL